MEILPITLVIKTFGLVKLSAEGEVVWKHNYGGSGNYSGSDITFDAQQQQIVVIGSTLPQMVM